MDSTEKVVVAIILCSVAAFFLLIYGMSALDKTHQQKMADKGYEYKMNDRQTSYSYRKACDCNTEGERNGN